MCCTLLLSSCDFGTSFDQLVLLRVNLQGAVILQQGKCLLLVLKFILCVYVLALFSFCVCALKYDCVCRWWSCSLFCLLIFALMLLFFIHVRHLQWEKNVSACLVVAGLHFWIVVWHMHCDAVVFDVDFWSDENHMNVLGPDWFFTALHCRLLFFPRSYLTVTCPEAQGNLMLA